MSNPQTSQRQSSLMKRAMSNPRVQRVVGAPIKAMSNAIGKFGYANQVTLGNAKGTMHEMGKFFTATEAKSSLLYAKKLTIETHDEIIKPKFSIARGAVKTVMGSQIKALRTHDLEITQSDDDEDDQ